MKLAALSPRTVTFQGSKAEKMSPVHAVRAYTDNVRDCPSEPDHVHLTPREREVLALLCAGFSNKLIGRRLNISAGTVKIHVSKVLGELGVASRLEAVVTAHRIGLESTIRESVSNASQRGVAPSDSRRLQAA